MSDFQTGLEYFAKKAASKPDVIYLLDTETTGLKGGLFDKDPGFRSATDPSETTKLDSLDWNRYGDLVLDIGVCEISLSKGTVKDFYSAIIGYDTSVWGDEKVHSWIFENSDLTIEKVAKGTPLSKVVNDITTLLKDKWVTSYNVQYDFDKFLYRFPWCLKGQFREVRDPMFSASNICKLKSQYYGVSEYRYPKLEYAYEKILEGEDPAHIEGVQDHRALSDARMASHLLLKMYREGLYDPMDFSGRHASS